MQKYLVSNQTSLIKEEREREVDEGGPNCNFVEMQGPYCNASITFKPVLKWR
jgi:hypothetical protein